MTIDSLLNDYLRDDAGTPLGPGMPSGRPLRADGQSHYEAWLSMVRQDPCSYCPGPGGTVDHIEPRSRPARGIGSVHGWNNTVGACSACNGAKADRDLLWFLYLRARGATHRPAMPAHATRRRACRWPSRSPSAPGGSGHSHSIAPVPTRIRISAPNTSRYTTKTRTVWVTR